MDAYLLQFIMLNEIIVEYMLNTWFAPDKTKKTFRQLHNI